MHDASAAGVVRATTRLVELITGHRRIDDARRLAAEHWRVNRVADRLALARFLILNNEMAVAAPLLDPTNRADASDNDALEAGWLLEALGEAERAIDAYERAMELGSLAAAERLIALLHATGDSARLAYAERGARLLGRAAPPTSIT